jgi:quercetin dioxygenase-like cupin family protein
MKNPTAFLSDPRRATNVVAFGDNLRILVFGNQTGGQFSIIEQTYALSEWGWKHRHRVEDHYVQITCGEMEFEVNGTMHAVATGQAIFIPKNTWHRFRTTGPTPATMLFFNFPGGLENMFVEIAEAEAEGIYDEDHLLAISQRYGVDVCEIE